MKKLIIVLMLCAGFVAQAQNKNAKSTIEVDGVCLMCKSRIEKASLNTKGVKSAVWNPNTHLLSLIFDERKTDLETIQANVANVGHDTEEIKATEDAYNSVHQCCRYRDEKVREDHEKEKKDDDGHGGH